MEDKMAERSISSNLNKISESLEKHNEKSQGG